MVAARAVLGVLTGDGFMAGGRQRSTGLMGMLHAMQPCIQHTIFARSRLALLNAQTDGQWTSSSLTGSCLDVAKALEKRT